MFDLLTIGDAQVDFLAEQVDTRLMNVQSFRKKLGGRVPKIAVAASRLGLKTAVISSLGEDELGDFIQQKLLKEGVSTQFLQQTSQQMTKGVFCERSSLEGVKKTKCHYYAVTNDFDFQTMDQKVFSLPCAVLITVSSIKSNKNFSQIVDQFKSYDSQIILDLDFDQGHKERLCSVQNDECLKMYRELMSESDLIIGNEQEFCWSIGKDFISEAIQKIREVTSAVLVMNLGKEGCVIFLSNGDSVKVPNTVTYGRNYYGAEEGFISGFLRGWIKGESLQNSAQWANQCFSQIVTRDVGDDYSPIFEEIEANCQNPCAPNAHSSSSLSVKSKDQGPRKREHEQKLFFAFDDWHFFQRECKKRNIHPSFVKNFKEKLFEGFVATKSHMNNHTLGVLIDSVFGQKIITKCEKQSLLFGIPVEKPLEMPIKWIDNQEAYPLVLSRSPSALVTVLWEYHSALNDTMKNAQLERLKHLSMACVSLERRMIIHLKSPRSYTEDGMSLSAGMKDIYDQGIYPDFWKIQAVENMIEWCQIDGVLKRHHSHARILLACDEENDLEALGRYFNSSCQSMYTDGFVFGRSMCREIWQSVISGKTKLSNVPSLVHQRYGEVLALWEQTKQRNKKQVQTA